MTKYNLNFGRIWTNVKIDKNYIPRTHETIGGRWTVDTWENDEWRAQLMDEGYTKVLFNKKTNRTWIEHADGTITEVEK